MSEFRVVKRADLPMPRRGPTVKVPHAKLHKSGMLFLSVVAVQALGNEDCQVMIEFDEEAMVLKLSVVDTLPKGITAADLFQLRVRIGKKNKRPMGTVYLKGLLHFIGHPPNGKSHDFPVVAFDPANRSLSVEVPADMTCEDLSN